MRDDEDENPKKPRPLRNPKKGSNHLETGEGPPWRMTRHDIDADQHRHVV